MRALLRDLARHREERAKRGQILVMFGLGLVVFLGFAALTVDIGFLLVSHRNYQNAADEAALAGAAYLTRPIGDPCADVSGGGSKHDCARASAWRYLRDDLGLAIDDAVIDGTLRGSNTPAAGQLVSTTDGGVDYRLWVSTPPNGAGSSASMSTVGTNRQVLFVRVDRVRSPFIIGVLGVGDLNVSAWATAGVIPERYAVITLRRGRGGTETDPGPANTTDIKLAGNGSKLTVVDGDVGGNWGMKLTADSRLELVSTGGDLVNVRLIDHESCGNSCWSSGQIYDANGTREPDRLPAWIPDPNYAPPTITAATWPNGLVDNAGSIPDIPNGDTGSPSGSPPNITIDAGTVTSTGTCVGPSGDDSDAPRLGPGTYRDLRVRNNGCVILDPLWRYTDPEAGIPGGRTGVPTGQYPGVYYFTGNINIDNNGLIVGDGVTVIMRPTGAFSPNSGGVMDLNNGKANGGIPLKLGAWTTKGDSPYGVSGASWMYQTAQEADPRTYGVGIALYILKPPQIGTTDANGSDVIAVNAHAGLSWKGVTYAPNDNVAIAGQPHHDGIGQLISWTFTFNGGTNVTQTFDGPGDGPPYLIEPCVLVSGSCQ